MNALLIYMVKSAVYLAGFYLVYRLFLGSDTMYRRNRTFILLSVISALILPLITVETTKPSQYSGLRESAFRNLRDSRQYGSVR